MKKTNETIHCVLLTDGNTEFLEEQLISIENQVISSQIHIHLININPNLEDTFDNLLSSYVKNSSLYFSIHHPKTNRLNFEKYYYIKNYLLTKYNPSKIFLLGNNQYYQCTHFNTLFNLYKSSNFATWKGIELDSPNALYHNTSDKFCDDFEEISTISFDIGETNFCMVNAEVFTTKSIFWDFEKPEFDIPLETLYKFDGLYLSWIIKKVGGEITRHSLIPLIEKKYPSPLTNPKIKYPKEAHQLFNYLNSLFRISPPLTNPKPFLIFTGVGDKENQFLSWCSKENKLFDRALNYQGNNKKISKKYKSLNTEFYFEDKEMIFENLVKHYDKFKNYEYILVVDSNLELDPTQLENTFKTIYHANISGCTWSRTSGGYGYFNQLYETALSNRLLPTNYMAMNFMMLKRTLLDKVIKQLKRYNNIKEYTGIDQFISGVAYNEGMLPFYYMDKYHFHNPYPKDEKIKSEIDKDTKTPIKEKSQSILDILYSNPEYFKSIKRIKANGREMSNTMFY